VVAPVIRRIVTSRQFGIGKRHYWKYLLQGGIASALCQAVLQMARFEGKAYLTGELIPGDRLEESVFNAITCAVFTFGIRASSIKGFVRSIAGSSGSIQLEPGEFTSIDITQLLNSFCFEGAGRNSFTSIGDQAYLQIIMLVAAPGVKGCTHYVYGTRDFRFPVTDSKSGSRTPCNPVQTRVKSPEVYILHRIAAFTVEALCIFFDDSLLGRLQFFGFFLSLKPQHFCPALRKTGTR